MSSGDEIYETPRSPKYEIGSSDEELNSHRRPKTKRKMNQKPDIVMLSSDDDVDVVPLGMCAF